MNHLPAWMRGATRHAYARPDLMGWAAWWERLGDVVAFEAIDGTMMYEWGDEEYEFD